VNDFAFIELPEIAGLDINERGVNGGGQCRTVHWRTKLYNAAMLYVCRRKHGL